MIDPCSASWATDENLTVTHTGRATVSDSIAAEGLDYSNPKQTPPNHSEGSLWGSSAPDGRSTMHHMLFAHNRLRNPRTVAGGEPPPVLTFYNNLVHDGSEYPTHSGSERVHVQWLNNCDKPGRARRRRSGAARSSSTATSWPVGMPLATSSRGIHVGCRSQSLIVIRR